MVKKYCKYTREELKKYCEDENCCVKCVTQFMHIGIPPWGLSKLKETVIDIVSKEKFCRFDEKLNGIVLDIRRTKLLSSDYSMHNDSPALHADLEINFYVFQPHIGAILQGIIKHVAIQHISVTIHRFFNVSIPIKRKDDSLTINKAVMIRLTKIDFEETIPYFEGILENYPMEVENSIDSGISTAGSIENKVKCEKIKNGQTERKGDSESNTDSDSDSDTENEDLSKVKVKKEPITTSESSSTDSDSEEEEETKSSIGRISQSNVVIKKEVTSTSYSSDDSSSSNRKVRRKREKAKRNIDRVTSPSTSNSSDDASVSIQRGKSKHEKDNKASKVTIKKEQSSASSSSDDTIVSNQRGKTKHRNVNRLSEPCSNIKKEKPSPSLTAIEITKKRLMEKENCTQNGSQKSKKIKNEPSPFSSSDDFDSTNNSFASPGLSSTRISKVEPNKKKLFKIV